MNIRMAAFTVSLIMFGTAIVLTLTSNESGALIPVASAQTSTMCYAADPPTAGTCFTGDNPNNLIPCGSYDEGHVNALAWGRNYLVVGSVPCMGGDCGSVNTTVVTQNGLCPLTQPTPTPTPTPPPDPGGNGCEGLQLCYEPEVYNSLTCSCVYPSPILNVDN